jgi:urease accessory protein
MAFSSLKPCFRIAAATLVFSAALHTSAFAHVGAHAGGLAAGFAHPFSGVDHVLAMVAVGLWASQIGRPAVWVLPLAFPAVMAIGAAFGVAGLPLPGLEIGIAASVLVLGTAVALAWRPAISASVTLVAVFALLHGWSHGTELPPSASALAYAAGFILATLALHAIGLAVGLVTGRPSARLAPRAAGVAIAACGALLVLAS